MAARTACSLIVLILGGLASAQTPPPGTASSPYSAWPAARLDAPRPTKPAAATLTKQAQPKQPGGVRPEDRAAPPPPVSETEAPLLQATINLVPPGIETIAQSVQSDESLFERIRQENRERSPMERVVFPPDPVLTRDTYHGRKWDPMKLEVAPYYVCYGRLTFEQKNFERYGWDLGVLTPLISGSLFLWDFVTWPYQLAREPCRCFEYNSGYCLPGDPVPLLLYPVELSATGFVAEAATIVALVAIFP
jgi:hypothetical protein